MLACVCDTYCFVCRASDIQAEAACLSLHHGRPQLHTAHKQVELEILRCERVCLCVCALPPPLCPPTPPQKDPHCCNLALASVSFHLCTAAQERHILILCVCVCVSV